MDVLIKLIADGGVIAVVLIGAWALIWKVPSSHRLESYSRILMAGLTAYAAAKLIASIYQPEAMRPFQQLGVHAGALFLNNPGFPSDHTLFSAAITFAVWFETRLKKTSLVLAGLTLLVALGRVLALVHTPLDVIGGLVIACAGIPWYLQRPDYSGKHHAPAATGKKSKVRVE